MTSRDSQNTYAGDDRIRLLDLAAVPIREWKSVLGALALVLLTAVVWYVVRPDRYMTTTTLVPSPGESNGRSQLASQLPAALAIRLPGSTPNNERLVDAILKSQTLRDSLAARISARHPNPDAMAEEVYRILAKETQIRQNQADRSIAIDVTAKDPRLAVEVAAEFPTLISELATDLSVTSAYEKRRVLERQLVDARERLVQSEQRLLEFQQSRGAIDVAEQARQTFATAAELEQAVIEQELKVGQLRRMVTPDHPDLRAAVSQLAIRREQLRRLTSGARSTGDVLLTQRDLPEIRVEAIRRMREYSTDEQVYLSLTAALAATQVDVNDNLALVSVLDAPKLPEDPAGSLPRLLVTSILLGLVLGLLVAYGKEFARQIRRDPENSAFMAALAEARNDIRGIAPHRARRGTQSPPAA